MRHVCNYVQAHSTLSILLCASRWWLGIITQDSTSLDQHYNCMYETVDGFGANLYTCTCSLFNLNISICEIKNTPSSVHTTNYIKIFYTGYYKLRTCFGPIRQISSHLGVIAVIKPLIKKSVKWLDDKESERTCRGEIVTLFRYLAGIWLQSVPRSKHYPSRLQKPVI